jgi:small subunit ribosomal protein S4
MARYLGSKCKKCRQLGFSVCGSGRCALERRNTLPGEHAQLRRKTSDFKKRLLEKQKLRFSYWVSDKQFREYVKRAFRKHGISGETLVTFLERRLDNIVYRMGFAPSLLAARQMVLHGHILVNGRKVDQPSYSLKERDEISVREKSRKMPLVEEGLARSIARPKLPYVEVDRENLKGTLTLIPKRAQIPLEINESIIMEHYSRYI